jgi:AbrB family looped-hinge helix DNA binding protein
MDNAISQWYDQAMEISIDKAGRLILPKPIRDRLGLREDSKLRVHSTAENIVLTPVEPPAGLIRDQDGWLVFSGGSAPEIDWDTLVESDREDRMRKMGGW